jgi:hypothetical protein
MEMKMKIVVHVYSHSADQRDQKDVMPWMPRVKLRWDGARLHRQTSKVV